MGVSQIQGKCCTAESRELKRELGKQRGEDWGAPTESKQPFLRRYCLNSTNYFLGKIYFKKCRSPRETRGKIKRLPVKGAAIQIPRPPDQIDTN